ncbi:uncharacterized protein LOC107680723 isoform X3 [Sinocyclocheilus anshuiensis]|uniref:uncharacterized protein LOC107680723 isoform X3 n=1 Tax=Sinocyclocheilus anshuiensis TaxID=1608454 RepID=UPI0007BA0DE4|nr:PREDICTED: uncharacterized protein LOC107680723 isoform X3 [Sinocyclocheilus anshuiensis]
MGVTHGKKADHNHQSHNSACAQPLTGPDLVSDLGSVIDPEQRWGREEDLDQSKLLPEQTDSGYYEELIRPKKLHNPVKASKSHRELQRELIITHKRGAVVEEKPELQRVLQQRNRAQALKQDIKQDKEKSPLEQELLKRQMRQRENPAEHVQNKCHHSSCFLIGVIESYNCPRSPLHTSLRERPKSREKGQSAHPSSSG